MKLIVKKVESRNMIIHYLRVMRNDFSSENKEEVHTQYCSINARICLEFPCYSFSICFLFLCDTCLKTSQLILSFVSCNQSSRDVNVSILTNTTTIALVYNHDFLFCLSYHPYLLPRFTKVVA